MHYEWTFWYKLSVRLLRMGDVMTMKSGMKVIVGWPFGDDSVMNLHGGAVCVSYPQVPGYKPRGCQFPISSQIGGALLQAFNERVQ